MKLLRSGLMRQVDQTTCGSAVLVALRAAGEGRLDQALAQPNELEQLGMHAATSYRGLGPLTWPQRFGTPPWAAAREARFPGARYVVRWLTPVVSAPRAASVLAAAHHATQLGFPVPLYCGGAPGLSVEGLPRHVVLALPGGGGQWRIYDPAVGSVFELGERELLTSPGESLGGWSHLWAALLPVPV
ncbi:hypothetical protein ABYF34_04900 [Buchananella felis]|uniref:hypothetical protein n=1 Tax=Buchananella felis TaxID=3231492 RepID=UPI0035288984